MKRAVRFGIPLVVTVVLGYLLLRRISLAEMVKLASGISPVAGVVLILLTALFVGLRGLRFRAVISTQLAPNGFIGPAAAYTLSAQLLPGGAGELTLPVLLSPLGISAGQSMAMLVVCRLLDLVLSLTLGAVL